MTIQLSLPDADEAGQVRRWFLPITDLGSRSTDFEYHVAYGRFLGLGTSFTESHSANASHPGGFVARGIRCNACRWFETRIFRELVLPDGVDDLDALVDSTFTERDVRLGAYVMHFAGLSVVDGEVPLCRVETTSSPFTVIEAMTTRRVTSGGPEAFIAKPAAHALAEAAANDRQLADAYVNRAVS